jgi:hypothetical protein
MGEETPSWKAERRAVNNAVAALGNSWRGVQTIVLNRNEGVARATENTAHTQNKRVKKFQVKKFPLVFVLHNERCQVTFARDCRMLRGR